MDFPADCPPDSGLQLSEPAATTLRHLSGVPWYVEKKNEFLLF